MSRRRKAAIAPSDEVLQVFTSIMRGEMTEEATRKGASGEERIAVPPKISERCKAAELLGKQYGLFDRKEELQPKGEVTAIIRRTLEQLHDRPEAPSP